MSLLLLDGPFKGEVLDNYFPDQNMVGNWNDLLESYECRAVDMESNDEGS